MKKDKKRERERERGKSDRLPLADARDLTLDNIDPALHGERFSQNIHAWVKRNTVRRGTIIRPFPTAFYGRGRKDSIESGPFLGWLNECGCCPHSLSGSPLSSIMTGGGGRRRGAEVGCWTNLPLEEWPEFWGTYLLIGRRVVDPEHQTYFANAEHRYKEEGDLRTCLWCGEAQRRERYTVTTERERWVLVKEAP